MVAKSEDSSLPIHIGQTIVNGLFEVKKDIGKLGGQMEGMQNSISEIHARVSHTMTREECAAIVSQGGHGKKPTGESRKPTASGPTVPSLPTQTWWDSAHKRIGVILGLLMLLSLFGGAGLWMIDAYRTIQKAQTTLSQLDGGP